MTINEFSIASDYERLMYLTSNIDTTILGWLVLKNRSIPDIDKSIFNLKYGRYLNITSESDVIFNLVNLFETRGLKYQLLGTEVIEVLLSEYIMKLI